MEWLSWANVAYMAGILIGGYITISAVKYKNMLKEVQEALNTYHEAAKDGEITKAERDKIVKEVLDILSAGVKMFWKF